ncbi:MAG TPA: hypothetical protein VJ873_10300 [bacterium]|nr:hypothetical protein [bacterium]
MLFTNSFPESEIVRIVNDMSAFIKAQREAFAPQATPLSAHDCEVFRPFFGEAVLKTTLFYRKTDGPFEPPDFLKEMNDKGVNFFLDRMEAVTLMDVVVSYHGLEPNIQFHELVHAVQYQKLGLKQFANKYIRGLLSRGSYEKIPLEVNAHQLEDKFFKNPSEVFSVEAEIQRWINENKF